MNRSYGASSTVRVRAALSAISHGTEMLVYRGEVDADLALDLPTLAGGYGFPVKFGYASVGRVVVAACDLDNTEATNAPFRYRALYGRLSEDTFLHVLITLGKSVTNEQAQTARQIAATVVFY